MKNVFATTCLMVATVILANAQTPIRNEKMSHDSEKVIVTIDIDTDNAEIPARRKEVITPYIYNGKDTLYLDVVEVYGKGRFKRERQINAIAGDKDWNLGQGQLMKKAGVYNYESQVPLKRWMTSATLGVKRSIVGCACEKEGGDTDLIQTVLFQEPQVLRRLPEYAPTEISRRWDIGQDELEIVFKVSKVEIDSSIFDNEVTFEKILETVDKIYSNPLYRIEKLHVAGYASPEGPEGFNKWLGINRAKALINYIINQRPEYGLTEENFEIHNGEENWVGLNKVLAESEMVHKEEVIRIIDDSRLTAVAKKNAIRALYNGKVWADMLNEIYPKLRSARYLAVYYDSSADDLAEVIKQANNLIAEGQYSEAYEKVISYKEDPRASGTIGLSLMMQKQFEEAMPWLEKALEGGCQAAQKNIDSIQAEYQWEEQQRQEITEYLKKYE